ncbi:hypothetical protein Tco_0303323 [Tanacetum coccineum]
MGCMIRAKLEVNTARLKKLVLLAEVSTASRVNEARGAKDTLGILFWGVMHKRFGVITSWDFCYDLKSLLSNVEQFKSLRFPVAPPSPDYVPGPEHPPSPDYVPGPEHPPSPVEDLEEDPKEDHADYLAGGGDDDDEPSDDDDDDTNDEDKEPFEDEDDDEEEEEHLVPTDPSVVPVVDPVLSAGDTGAFEMDESAPIPRSPQTKVPFAQTRLRRARKTVRLEPPMSPSMEARIAEYVAAPTPPSLLSPWSPPLPHFPSPPLPPPPSSLHLPPPVPTSLPLPSSPLPSLPASLFIPPPVDRREDIPEAELPPRKRLCPTAPTLRYKVGESSTAAPRPTGGYKADYRFIGTMDTEIRRQRAKEVGYGNRDV